MAPKAEPPKDEPYSTNAYFETIMACSLYRNIPKRVMTNPKFWDFLESRESKSTNEEWADAMMRRQMGDVADRIDQNRSHEKALQESKVIEGGKPMRQESAETLESKIESIPEGGKFQFLRDVFCMVDGSEEEEEVEEDEDETEDEPRDEDETENEKSTEEEVEQELFEMDELVGLEPWDAVAANWVWEWTKSDSEAGSLYTEGHWTEDGPRGRPEWIWEWTHYDSEAEREEARREHAKRDQAERDSLEMMRGNSE